MVADVVDWGTVEDVMLDMDGTVLDLAFDDYFWGELLPQRYAQRHGLSLAAAQRSLAPLFESGHGTLKWYSLDFWSERTGLDMAALTREVADRVALLPGSTHFLETVRASGRRLWLVTNAHRDSWRVKLQRTHLARYFDHVVSSHDLGVAKEQAEFWPQLRGLHAFRPERSLFVDDTMTVLDSARRYGFTQLVAITRPNSTRPARNVVSYAAVESLSALLPINAG
ncbi:MAG TPA: GMP/IMP nucleotidase [Nevskiaceae bacterium]